VLSTVEAGTLNTLYAALLSSGRKSHAGGGLSRRSVQHVHAVVHRMLRDAVKWGRLARNPADAADPPRLASTHAEMTTWDAAETATFLASMQDNRLGAAFLMLATTGARRGEVLGLRWSDINLETGPAAIQQTVITVRDQPAIGEPKTSRGRRTIDLGAVTVAALREHRKTASAGTAADRRRVA
jgi:integrase